MNAPGAGEAGSSRAGTFALRSANPSDASVVAALHAASWRDAYAGVLDPAFLQTEAVDADRLEFWRARLAQPDKTRRLVLALEDAAPIGFVCAFGGEDPKWGTRVDNLHVGPAARGRGVGAALLRSTAEWSLATSAGFGLHLWVFQANTRAVRFYERLGGRLVGQGASAIPSAHGACVLHLHWPDPSELVRRAAGPGDGVGP